MPSATRSAPALEAVVRPPWPYRLPRGGGADRVMRAREGLISRLLHIGERPILVRSCQRRDGDVVLHAAGLRSAEHGRTPREDLEEAIARMRFALSVDEDLSEFREAFRGDRLVEPSIRAASWYRPSRRPFAWEALAWAVTEQLIEAVRAHQIQRRMVRAWGRRCPTPWGQLPDVPTAQALADRAPAEMVAMDLAPQRAVTLRRVAEQVARGRVDPADPGGDRRLIAMPGIGPWTLQRLGLHGRGEADSLPAGDLAYVKLVGVLAGLGRRATVAEVEEYFARYAPFRGLAGAFILRHHHGSISAAARGLPLAPDALAA